MRFRVGVRPNCKPTWFCLPSGSPYRVQSHRFTQYNGKHCTPVQRFARRGQGASGERVIPALIAQARWLNVAFFDSSHSILFLELKHYVRTEQGQVVQRIPEHDICAWGCGDLAVSLLASHQGDPGSIPGRVTPDSRMREGCRTMPLVGGFSRGFPASPAPSFRRRSVLTSVTPICSEDIDVKSRPSLSTIKCPIQYNVSSERSNAAHLKYDCSDLQNAAFVSMEQRRDIGAWEAGYTRENPFDQRHRLARFPHAKNQKRPRRVIEPGTLRQEASSLTTALSRPPSVGGGSSESMRVIEVRMERNRNLGAGEAGDPREGPLTNGIVRHDSHMRKSFDQAGLSLRPALSSPPPHLDTRLLSLQGPQFYKNNGSSATRPVPTEGPHSLRVSVRRHLLDWAIMNEITPAFDVCDWIAKTPRDRVRVNILQCDAGCERTCFEVQLVAESFRENQAVLLIAHTGAWPLLLQRRCIRQFGHCYCDANAKDSLP
ncbi:hypothetical protein PR048_026938 [Dryococelus australis]|uniref:Uncharacterized protein n=1 Tax=Dryococelus australis TaxID=614101 RepID=A0ABQ9GMQ8_9NEOP|nr:hypothetical protein PR048_026938 [Dryococelus australis]